MYTGNTSHWYRRSTSPAVYPCVYREHFFSVLNDPSGSGLSLCIQGTLLAVLRFEYWLRFIPVYTGNTVTPVCFSRRISVYPCVYREHITPLIVGSGISRFIPVYTGNTIPCGPGSPFSPVYPCVYREHLLFNTLIIYFCGLSLCIQGTL